jgi:hypothetical protein
MTQVQMPELAAVLTRPARPVAPRVEDAVRVAAATLSRASVELIMSTTVVVDIGADDLDALSHLVHQVAGAHDFDVEIKPHVGWCAVRFSHRKPTSR